MPLSRSMTPPAAVAGLAAGIILSVCGDGPWSSGQGTASGEDLRPVSREQTRESPQQKPPARSVSARVQSLLTERCLECHSGTSPEGGLDLTVSERIDQGGDGGAVLHRGQPEKSRLWQRVRDDEMPPEPSLSRDEKQLLYDWIEAGAPWEGGPIDLFRTTSGRRAGYDWWSLKPLQTPTPPDDSSAVAPGWARNPIDAFILDRLSAAGLEPSPEADRRTLIRRVTFDMLGLPPDPAEVSAFLADPRPDAFERLVDRILASPDYGVRWGRHWLDVVRFGESQGFERDRLRENAWPYRDWVIHAFNVDMPYDEFARMQLAGDVLRPEDPQAVTATGFLVAAPWDEVGMNQQSAAMKAVVRQDELEDIVGVVSQSFLGLTVNCARCHDHKFDPVRQTEYYRMVAALNGVWHGSRSVISRQNRRRGEELEHLIQATRHQIDELQAVGRRRVTDRPERDRISRQLPQPIARWTFDDDLRDSIGQLHGRATGDARVEDGALVLNGRDAFVSTPPLTQTIRQKTLEVWVRLSSLDQRGGGAVSVQTTDGARFDAIVFGEREPRRWMAGSNGFVRTKSFHGQQEREADRRFVHVAIVYQADGTVKGYRDGQRYGTLYATDGPAIFEQGQAHVVFGLRHGTAAGGNRMLHGSIDAAQLYDCALTDEQVEASAAWGDSTVTQAQIVAALNAGERAQLAKLQQKLAQLSDERKAVQPLSVYAAVPRAATVEHVRLRGNPNAKGSVVSPGGIAAVSGVRAEFDLPPDASDAERRTRLAEWVTARENPLFARVIVNRVWHYHFGTGLVDTPSDLGFNGGRPSHPELIDWLASEFIRRGYRLKALHRLILTSATYRQAGSYRPRPAQIDAENRLLWRKNPRRLEAEAIRDATLDIAGVLNESFGGPGYRDFDTHIRNTQFYEMRDKVGPAYNRRSVYRTWVRSGRQPFLDVFDCPDPSAMAPKRAVTVTPLQALSLMNNSFVLRMADRLAERVRREAGDEPVDQIDLLFQLAYARRAGQDEHQLITPFLREHGLPEFCRIVLNSSEFLYVD